MEKGKRKGEGDGESVQKKHQTRSVTEDQSDKLALEARFHALLELIKGTTNPIFTKAFNKISKKSFNNSKEIENHLLWILVDFSKEDNDVTRENICKECENLESTMKVVNMVSEDVFKRRGPMESWFTKNFRDLSTAYSQMIQLNTDAASREKWTNLTADLFVTMVLED